LTKMGKSRQVAIFYAVKIMLKKWNGGGRICMTPAMASGFNGQEPAGNQKEALILLILRVSSLWHRWAQWEKDGIETAGLVKIDLLGNRSLGVIRDSIASVKTRTGKFDDFDTLFGRCFKRSQTIECQNPQP